MLNYEKIDYKQLTQIDIRQLDPITKNKIDDFFQKIQNDEEIVIAQNKLENIGNIIKACKKIEKLRQKKKNKKLQREVTYVMNAVMGAAAKIELQAEKPRGYGSLAAGFARFRQMMEEKAEERRTKTKVNELNEKITQLTKEATRKSIEGDFERAGDKYFEAAGLAREVSRITDNHDDYQRHDVLITQSRSEFETAEKIDQRKIKPEICIKIAKCSEILGEYSDAANRYYQASVSETIKTTKLDYLIKTIECEQKIKRSGIVVLARVDEVREQIKDMARQDIEQCRSRMFRILSNAIQKNAANNTKYPEAEVFYDRIIAIAERFGSGREMKIEVVRILKRLSNEKEKTNLRQAGDISYIAARYADFDLSDKGKTSAREICLTAAVRQYFQANEIQMCANAIDELAYARKGRDMEIKADEIVKLIIGKAGYKEIEALADKLADIAPIIAFEIQYNFYILKEGYQPSGEIWSIRPTISTCKSDIDKLRKDYHRWIDNDNRAIAQDLIKNELERFCNALGLRVNLRMIDIETVREGDKSQENGISEAIGRILFRESLPPKILIYGRFRGRVDRTITILHEYLHGVVYLSGPGFAYKQGLDFTLEGRATGRKVWLDEGLIEYFAQKLGKMAGIRETEVAYEYETSFISTLSKIFNDDRILANLLTSRDLTPVKKAFQKAFELPPDDTTFDHMIAAENVIDAITIMKGRVL